MAYETARWLLNLLKGERLLETQQAYLIFWEEWANPETGECHESTAGVMSYDAIVTENNYGNLKVLRRPLAKPFDPQEIRRAVRLPLPAAKMKRVGYDYILHLIKENAPLDHKIRKHGWDKAFKDLHTLGMGIETFRALQRVEIDEYTVDLLVFMQSTGLFEHLPQSKTFWAWIVLRDASPCLRHWMFTLAVSLHFRLCRRALKAP